MRPAARMWSHAKVRACSLHNLGRCCPEAPAEDALQVAHRAALNELLASALDADERAFLQAEMGPWPTIDGPFCTGELDPADLRQEPRPGTGDDRPPSLARWPSGLKSSTRPIPKSPIWPMRPISLSAILRLVQTKEVLYARCSLRQAFGVRPSAELGRSPQSNAQDAQGISSTCVERGGGTLGPGCAVPTRGDVG
jgi:hypothetical protein